jgi:formate hydrogenlyase subunit 5
MKNPTSTDNLLLNKICLEYFSSQSNKDVYVPVSDADFERLVPFLPDMEIILIDLFCVENFEKVPGFTLFYVLEKRGSRNLVYLQRHLQNQETTSVAVDLPSACWFERQIQDGFGIEFSNAFDKRRLFLHEAYPSDFHPLLKSFKNRDISDLRKSMAPRVNYVFKEVEGEGVYQVAVGPVHAGIIEPGHFRFSVIGETITNLEVRMFFKHRGIEKLAEGQTVEAGVMLAETISGDETAANAVAYCMAIEKIAGVVVPERALQIRTIMLEMERIYSHLGDLAGMLVDIAFPVGASEFLILREEILRYNQILTGSRFMKGMLCPGGLKKDIATKNLMLLDTYLNPFRKRFKKAFDFASGLDSVLDRLETTGVIKKELINPLNISGPAARASGADIDNRVDHPYGLYSTLPVTKRKAAKGDVLARFEVKMAEVMDSTCLIQKLANSVKSSETLVPFKVQDGFASAIVEAARGQNFHWIYVKNGVIERYRVRTASFCNWQSIEHAVMGNIIPDFPLINKSLNLSYAGTDG